MDDDADVVTGGMHLHLWSAFTAKPDRAKIRAARRVTLLFVTSPIGSKCIELYAYLRVFSALK